MTIDDIQSLTRIKFEAIERLAIISTTDLSGKITSVNENFCRISGYREEELIGQHHRIVKSGFHPKEVFTRMWSEITQGRVWRGQVKNKTKDGGFYWVEALVMPIKDGNEKIIGYISFRFDITAEKLAEEALEQEKIKSIHLSRLSSIGEVASGIAHEINNPLATIGGLVAISKKRVKTNMTPEEVEKTQEGLERMQKQIERVAKIINGLRAFSRSGEDQETVTANTQEICRSVHELLAERLVERQIEFRIKALEHTLNCHQLQIEQVLVNLVGNAIDAVTNLEQKWIELEVQDRGGFIQFSVTDSGAGIPKDVADKMMQPFFTTKSVGQGTGLGLSISKGIVERHAGSLSLDSSSSHTRFVVLLPKSRGSLLELINVDEAISAHLAWRQKLIAAIGGNSKLDPQVVGDAKACALGRWLMRIKPRFENSVLFRELVKDHESFHRYAEDLVRRSLGGQGDISEALVGSGTEYDVLSKKVIAGLQQFRSEAEKESSS